MFSEFLNLDTTYPAALHDFSEWHKGIKYFGFWAIEISTPDCQNKIRTHQEDLSDKLHAYYLRQPHITLVASGLLSDNYFHQDLITRQVEQIKKSNIKSFSLQLSGCNSFATCPYLSVRDPLGRLDSIRECLNNISEENDSGKYTPHVTLGFYNKAYKTSDIVKDISELSSNDIEFTVNEVVFAQYETRDVQGPYQVLHRITLERRKGSFYTDPKYLRIR
ncbi:2'-5' RNA ligase family protein [Neptunomonas antarctica]|uniref:2'-5' RNA ligase n=1 Tax=Neptunomonas antarctica TaxID=619304 RepID=A0A1N7KWP4_9GAMM|nr:2'-5' RNA ligase family protein [Neptunomonas antarctica]SIS66029.1 2'-5' RNA ligase [Neptunomonas antarctica]